MSRVFSQEEIRRGHQTMRERSARRFWTRVHVVGDCWEWQGYRQTRGQYGGGYGLFNMKYAHRMAYELVVGPIPSGMEVLHSCDNPPCVRPEHLSVGTHLDNMRDAARKGRFSRKARAA